MGRVIWWTSCLIRLVLLMMDVLLVLESRIGCGLVIFRLLIYVCSVVLVGVMKCVWNVLVTASGWMWVLVGGSVVRFLSAATVFVVMIWLVLLWLVGVSLVVLMLVVILLGFLSSRVDMLVGLSVQVAAISALCRVVKVMVLIGIRVPEMVVVVSSLMLWFVTTCFLGLFSLSWFVTMTFSAMMSGWVMVVFLISSVLVVVLRWVRLRLVVLENWVICSVILGSSS